MSASPIHGSSRTPSPELLLDLSKISPGSSEETISHSRGRKENYGALSLRSCTPEITDQANLSCSSIETISYSRSQKEDYEGLSLTSSAPEITDQANLSSSSKKMRYVERFILRDYLNLRLSKYKYPYLTMGVVALTVRTHLCQEVYRSYVKNVPMISPKEFCLSLLRSGILTQVANRRLRLMEVSMDKWYTVRKDNHELYKSSKLQIKLYKSSKLQIVKVNALLPSPMNENIENLLTFIKAFNPKKNRSEVKNWLLERVFRDWTHCARVYDYLKSLNKCLELETWDSNDNPLLTDYTEIKHFLVNGPQNIPEYDFKIPVENVLGDHKNGTYSILRSYFPRDQAIMNSITVNGEIFKFQENVTNKEYFTNLAHFIYLKRSGETVEHEVINGLQLLEGEEPYFDGVKVNLEDIYWLNVLRLGTIECWSYANQYCRHALAPLFAPPLMGITEKGIDIAIKVDKSGDCVVEQIKNISVYLRAQPDDSFCQTPVGCQIVKFKLVQSVTHLNSNFHTGFDLPTKVRVEELNFGPEVTFYERKLIERTLENPLPLCPDWMTTLPE